MSVALRCKCHNVTVYLEHTPVKQENVAWLKNFQLPKGVGKANLDPVAAVSIELKDLVKTHTIAKDSAATSDCLVCLNCSTFIYSTLKSGQVLVNNALIPRVQRDTSSQQGISSSFYSPVWKVVLDDDDDCTHSMLEPPDASDTSRYEAFKVLEKQMQDYLLTEEKNMEDRIREFKQKQQEEFRELQTRAYRDRKVLWHKLNRLITNPPNISALIESPPSPAGVGKKEPIQEKPSAPAPSDSQESSEPSQAKTTWKTSQVSTKKLVDSDFLFQFDDEEIEDTKSEAEEPAPEPEDETNDVDADDFYDPRPSSFQIACSVPVSIPAQFAALGADKPKLDAKLEAGQLSPLHIKFGESFDTPASRSRDKSDLDMLSKSFAVPVSRNKVRRWL